MTVSDYFLPAEVITADYEPGSSEAVNMPDGSVLELRKLDEGFDVHDRVGTVHYVQSRQAEGEVVTGLLYVDPDASDCHEVLDTVQRPLNELQEVDLCPGNGALGRINESFR